MWRNLLAVLLASGCVCAQEVARTGTLTGFVTDPTGLVVAGVKITAVNQETKFTASAVTNDTGRYSIPYLNPGGYEMRMESPGFKTYVRSGIQLLAGESPRIDVQMEIGAVSDSIMVSGAAQLIETETATVSATLPHDAVMRLNILQDRSFNVLMYEPGAVNTSEASFNMLGQRARSIGNEVDGVSAKMPVQGTPVGDYQALLVGIDALEEARVITTGVPAEFGGAGSGLIVQVSRSGTNQLHGSGEDRYINTDFLHRSYFAATPQTPISFHDISATLGGPIVIPKLYNGRDKTFFFFGYQRQNERDGFSEMDNVPTQAMLNGDFSLGGIGFPIYDPRSMTQTSTGAWTAAPFPNNQIPQDKFDPVAKKFLSYQPWRPPNQAGFVQAAGPQQNLLEISKNRSYRSRFSWKVDQQLSSVHKLFVRVTWNHHRPWSNQGNAQFAWPLLNAGAVENPRDWVGPEISDTYTISPTVINEFHVAMNRFTMERRPNGFGQNWTGTLGIPNASPAAFPEFPDLPYPVNLGGFAQSIAGNWTFSENLTKIMGRNTFKVGYQAIKSLFNNLNQDAPSGIYNFSGSTAFPFQPNTGNAFASFLLGAVSSAQFTKNYQEWIPRWWQHAVYFQDDLRPTRNLTLNLGVRWSYETPYQAKYESQFDPAVVDSLTGKMGAITHPTSALAKQNWHNFQPRIGVAWTMRKNLVFRGNFGISTMDLLSNDTNVAFDEYVATANVQAPPGDPRPAFYLSQGPPAQPFTVNPNGTVPYVGTNYSQRTATRFDPNMHMPYIMSWGGGLQYQFRANWMLETRYEGTAGVALLNWWNINQLHLNVSTDPAVLAQIYPAQQNYLPYPQFGSIRGYGNYGHSTYHAGTVRVAKQFSHGLSLNTFYTFSKAIDNADGEAQATGVDFYNRSLEKGLAGFNRTHRFVNTVMYDLPFGAGQRFMNSHGVLNAVLGGWKLTWNDTLQSGAPFSVTYSGSPSHYLTGGGVSRPNILVPNAQAVVSDWHIGPNRFPTSASNPYLNASAFAYPAAFTAGTLGRNTFKGRPAYYPQGSLSKEWVYRERARVSVRWNMNNVVNYPSFSTPSSTYNTSSLSTFGHISNTIGQFGGIGGPLNQELIVRIQF